MKKRDIFKAENQVEFSGFASLQAPNDRSLAGQEKGRNHSRGSMAGASGLALYHGWVLGLSTVVYPL